MHSDTLLSLSQTELYTCLFNQKGNTFIYKDDGSGTETLDDQPFYNILILLLNAIVMTFAVDTPLFASAASRS